MTVMDDPVELALWPVGVALHEVLEARQHMRITGDEDIYYEALVAFDSAVETMADERAREVHSGAF